MNPLHFAVVVGINDYPELEPLQSAVGDARKFARWLGKEDGGGVEDDKLELITANGLPDGATRTDAHPKKGEVHDALYRAARRCEEHVDTHPEDWDRTRLWVYLSGHGLAPVPQEAALLMADAGPDWYGENLPCGRFARWYEAAQSFHEVIFLADCCRYWVDDAPLAGPPWTKRRGNWGKVYTMTGFATFFGDPAYEPPDDEREPPDERRSYFTSALLEGLDEGRAVDPESHRIDSNSLARYVKNRVKNLTRDKRFPQEPQVFADPATPIVFRTLSPAQVEAARTVAVTLRLTTPYDGEVALLDGRFAAIERRPASAEPWEVQLEPGLYRVHPTEPDGSVDPNTANPFHGQGYLSVVGEDLDVEL